MENLLPKATDLFKGISQIFSQNNRLWMCFWWTQHIRVGYSHGIPGRAIEDERVFVMTQEETLYIIHLLLEETYIKIIYELVAWE